MGQKDPLVEWQREGYEMFGSLMKGIAQDFVSYVMHVQVVRNDAPALTRAERAADVRATTSQPDGFAAAAQAAAASGEIDPAVAAAAPLPRTGQAADHRQGRVVEDAAQRAVPVRQSARSSRCATAQRS